MWRVFGKKEIPPECAITIGAFDGVHLGHRRVLYELLNWAEQLHTNSLVLTFDPPPRAVLSDKPLPIITPLGKRLSLIESLGVDISVVLDFDEALASVEAEEFIKDYIIDWLRAKAVVVGYDCRFGKGGRGDKSIFRKFSEQGFFQFRSCEPVYAEGILVSASAVRSAVARGELDLARKLLGRPFSVIGKVVHGAGRGKSLGFPTANILPQHSLRPPDGVYTGRTLVRGELFPSLISIGHRPTFNRQPRHTVIEVHLEGFSDSLYGETIEVCFKRYLRQQKAFDSESDLSVQLMLDEEELLEELRNEPEEEDESTRLY